MLVQNIQTDKQETYGQIFWNGRGRMDQRSSNAEQRRGGNLSPLSLLGAFLFLFLLTPPLLLLQWCGCGCLLVCVAASPLSGTVWHPTLASLSLASMEPATDFLRPLRLWPGRRHVSRSVRLVGTARQCRSVPWSRGGVVASSSSTEMCDLTYASIYWHVGYMPCWARLDSLCGGRILEDGESNGNRFWVMTVWADSGYHQIEETKSIAAEESKPTSIFQNIYLYLTKMIKEK
jgi:hypothetical protein